MFTVSDLLKLCAQICFKNAMKMFNLLKDNESEDEKKKEGEVEDKFEEKAVNTNFVQKINLKRQDFCDE